MTKKSLLLIVLIIFSRLHAGWAEETFNKLTIEEKIAQLFMVTVSSEPEDNISNLFIENLIFNNHIGGLIFFDGSIQKQAAMTNYLQAISKFPLLISQDSEWGLGMRLRDGINYPKNMTLGAIRDDSLIL